MPKRTIRLKEHELDLSTHRDATDRIRELSDDSLPEGPYVVRTDSDGFISTGNEVDADAPDLFILGDSFVESHFAAENLRFASQVERGLVAAGTPYRVRNGGYSGMTSLHMLGVLTAKMPPLLKPGSKLLLVIGQSDVNALASSGLYWEQSKTVSPFGVPMAESTVLEQHWTEAFEQMVTAVVAFSRLHGYDMAISAGLFRNGDFDHDTVLQRVHRRKLAAYEASIEKRKFVISAVRSIARKNAIPLFDASTNFLERPELFYDVLHLNHDGQAAYSAALTSWISEDWLRPAPWWRRPLRRTGF